VPLTGSSSALSAALRTALLADPDTQALDDVALTAMCDAIASTVLAHLVANAVVLPALLVAPPGGGPVTGTGVLV
jgi:hypothetical protein